MFSKSGLSSAAGELMPTMPLLELYSDPSTQFRHKLVARAHFENGSRQPVLHSTDADGEAEDRDQSQRKVRGGCRSIIHFVLQHFDLFFDHRGNPMLG